LLVNLQSLLHKSLQTVRWEDIADAIISNGNELNWLSSRDPRLGFWQLCQDKGVLVPRYSLRENNIRCSGSITRTLFTLNCAKWGIRDCRIC